MHKFLGPVLQKVYFVPQVRHLRDGFNVLGDFPLHVEFESKWAKNVVCIVPTRQGAKDRLTHALTQPHTNAALLYPLQSCSEGIRDN